MISTYLHSSRRYVNIPSRGIRIFAFGCWNKNRHITEKIIRTLNRKTYDYGVILGDNIYARRWGGRIYLEDIAEGFTILSQSIAPIYIGLGNHDVDNSCDILAKELVISRQLGLNMPANWYQLGSNIFVLDTNLVYEHNKCYTANSVDTDFMLLHLRKALDSYKGRTPFIIFGHYPPLFYKSTDTKSQYILIKRMRQITELLLDYGRPIIYISADTHNYQHLQLANIDIYIAGTGGGDLDTFYRPPYNKDITINGNKFPVIVKDYKSSYGYLDINISNTVKIDFIPL